MKQANQVKVTNRTITILTCAKCGHETKPVGGINTKRVQAAMSRSCKACTPTRGTFNANGWWKEFGLDSNPYVYGPMLRKRTSQFYRMQEARRMGWMSWSWVDDDEYKDERKGLPQKY
jgi:hypothetical protein